MSKEIKQALELRENKKFEESNKVIAKLIKKYQNDAQINYQFAWSFDLLGKEREAAPYYEKSIELGLPENDLEDALLGLGSTYRVLGEYEKSKDILERGTLEFPSNQAMKLFYAMTLYNLNEHSKAMEEVLNVLLSSTKDEGILKYNQAIRYYSDKLDQVWE